MGFIAQTPVNNDIIVNANFWPDISTQKFADCTRLDGNVTPDRMRHELTKAIISINKEMAVKVFKANQIALTYADLAAVPAESVDGISELVFLYQSAVYNEARATLTEHYRDFDTTSDADKRIKTLDPQIGAYRRDCRNAIAELTGQGHAMVELI